MNREWVTRLGAGMILLVSIVSACSETPSRLTVEGHDCGEYTASVPPPAEAMYQREQQCLLTALSEGREAHLRVRSHTIEGDPVVDTFQVESKGTVLVEHDARADKFGSEEIERYKCSSLAQDGSSLLRYSECERDR